MIHAALNPHDYEFRMGTERGPERERSPHELGLA